MPSARVLVAVAGLIGVLISAGCGSSAGQGDDDESLVYTAGSTGYTDESQIDLPDVEPPGMFDPPTPAEMRDLATVAEASGISLEEAVATSGWRRGFSQLVQEVAGRHKESFAGAAIEQDGSIWIAFTGAVPADVVSLVGEFEREVLEPLASPARIDLLPNQDPQ